MEKICYCKICGTLDYAHGYCPKCGSSEIVAANHDFCIPEDKNVKAGNLDTTQDCDQCLPKRCSWAMI